MILEFYGAYSAFINAAILGVIFGIIYDIFRILRISRIPYLAPKGKFYKIIKIPERNKLDSKKRLKNFFCVSDTLLTFIEDLIFWLIVSIGEILFIYHINGGVVRIYFILFTFAGAALYFFTIGKFTVYFSVRIIFLARCLLYWSVYIIIYPVRLIGFLLLKFICFFANITVLPLVRAFKKSRIARYSKKRMLRILTQSKKGFFIYD